MTGARLGIDRVIAGDCADLIPDQARLGLLSNRAAFASDGRLTRDGVASAFGLAPSDGPGLARLFSPEHGWDATHEAGLAAPDGRDDITGLSVHSLYGPRATPNRRALADLDAVIVDLPDVGVRCYTYAATAAMFSATALEAGLKVVVCDRPNPLGPRTAGPRPGTGLRGLLAYFDVPFVHGLRLGGLLASEGLVANPQLAVIDCLEDGPPDPAIDWHPPSPSLTCHEAVTFYPGLVLLEGTNVSEGRGTDMPFRCVLAPWLDPGPLVELVSDKPELGAAAREITATPDAGKFAGSPCRGIALTPLPGAPVLGFELGVNLLAGLARMPAFEWTRSGGNYFVDRLLGGGALRHAVDTGVPAEEILAAFED
ncbi:MAG: DUF1343 domain-containing protein [Alphaproteobacteria bacterium]|nr:DUF1343 domain-containing protein [Alphaproteobacteria bacterium]